MKSHLLAYAVTAMLFLGFDFIWLTVMGTSFYRLRLGDMVLERFNLAPALVFYLLYVVGIVAFAISPAFDTGRWTTALGDGALFGFLAYATYDLTNQATLRNWPLTVTLVDLSWGTVLTAVSATLGYLISSFILHRAL
jgi:uncharacterized membrane protein